MLKVEKLSAGYSSKKIIRELSLSFEEGKVYALLGPNGVGKSTFLKALFGLIKSYLGAIYLNGEELSKLSLKELAKRLSYLPQKTSSLPSLTVYETILLGRRPHFVFEPKEKDYAVVEDIISELSLGELAFKRLEELSGGELQKVLLARALAQEPKVLLLDEPINHLDPKNQLEILKLLRTLTRNKNLITLIVLHDLNLALRFADYFIFLKDGKVFAQGDEEIITPELVSRIYEISVEIISFQGKKFLIPLSD